jgi:hypothetical protein
MQKVVGSSPIIRFFVDESPAQGLFCLGVRVRCAIAGGRAGGTARRPSARSCGCAVDVALAERLVTLCQELSLRHREPDALDDLVPKKQAGAPVGVGGRPAAGRTVTDLEANK